MGSEIAELFLWIVLIVAILALILPWLGGKRLALWMYLLYAFGIAVVVVPEVVSKKYLGKALELCSSDLKATTPPPAFEGLRDDTGLMTTEAVQDLLAERRIGFVELPIETTKDGKSGVKLSGRFIELLDNEPKNMRFMRIAIGQEGTGRCLKALGFSPFIHGSCLQASYGENSDATMSIQYEPIDEVLNGFLYRRLTLRNSTSQVLAASLTSVHQKYFQWPVNVASDGLSQSPKCFQKSSYTPLLSLIQGTAPPPQQALGEIDLQLTPDLSVTFDQASTLPTVTPKVQLFAANHSEMREISDWRSTSWQGAVRKASSNGWAQQGVDRIDLQRHAVMKIKALGTLDFKWMEDGLMAWNQHPWDASKPTEQYRIAKYSVSGNLLWSVQFVLPDALGACPLAVKNVYESEGEIQVWGECMGQHEPIGERTLRAASLTFRPPTAH